MSADQAAALSDEGRARLTIVLELLAAERASVSSVVDERAWRVHVADSLAGLEIEELRAASRITDVGAGAGFPGLALAVALPAARVDLIESVGRKCEFMERAIAAADRPSLTTLVAEATAMSMGRPRSSSPVRSGSRAAARLAWPLTSMVASSTVVDFSNHQDA